MLDLASSGALYEPLQSSALLTKRFRALRQSSILVRLTASADMTSWLS